MKPGDLIRCNPVQVPGGLDNITSLMRIAHGSLYVVTEDLGGATLEAKSLLSGVVCTLWRRDIEESPHAVQEQERP